jgi:hypothetical protein
MLHRSKERSHQVDLLAGARAAFRLRTPLVPFQPSEELARQVLAPDRRLATAV